MKLLSILAVLVVSTCVFALNNQEALERSKKMLDTSSIYFSAEDTSTVTLTKNSISPVDEGPQKIAILIDKPLYSSISNEVNAYIAGVEASVPFDVTAYYSEEWSTQNFEQVRAFIKNLWETDDIDGVILVGFFPYMHYNLPGQVRYLAAGNHADGQIGLIGYEDMDGDFLDLGAWVKVGENYEFQAGPPNGVYDHHIWRTDGGPYNRSTDNTLELWCSIVRPFQSTDDSHEYTPEVVDQVKTFFQKMDRYYSGETVVPQRGLSYCNKDWGNQTTYIGNILRGNYGSDQVDQAGGWGVYNSGQDYMYYLGRGYELCNFWSHSAGWFHNLDRWPWHDVQNYELYNRRGRGSMVTWGFNCHGSDFAETPTTGSMGQNYIFSGIGHVYIGSAMSYGVSYINHQIQSMIDGDSCGEAFRKAVQEEYQSNSGFNAITNMTIICQTINGNALVFANDQYRITAPPATAVGSFNYVDQKLELEVSKGDELFSYEFCDANGNFEIPFLEAGSYDVAVRTMGGFEFNTFSFEIARGESLDLGILKLGVPNKKENSWYYLSSSSMPPNWENPNADMGTNAFGPAPFGKQSDKGTYYELGSTRLYIRKTFVVDKDKVTESPVQLNVRSYNTTQDCGARVNGQNVSLQLTGTRPDYWLLSADMSSLLVEGTNVVVVWGKNYLDASAPEYLIKTEPELSVAPQLYFPNNQNMKDIKLSNAGSNYYAFTASKVQNSSWLQLRTTSGVVTNSGLISTAVSSAGLVPGSYLSDIFIDAGEAGSATVTVAMNVGVDDYRVSADWDTSVSGANPNGAWSYAYSQVGAQDFPYTDIPYYRDGCPQNISNVWLSDFPDYKSKVGLSKSSTPGADINVVVGNLSDKATAIGWKAPADGLIHSIRGYWEYNYSNMPIRVTVDHLNQDGFNTLYEYTSVGLKSYGGTILSTSSVFVLKDEMVYLTFSPNNEILEMPPITLKGDNCDYCVSFEAGVPEPSIFGLLFVAILLMFKRK